MADNTSILSAEERAKREYTRAFVAAVDKGDLDRAKEMLAKGADINGTISGSTALWIACSSRSWDIVLYLIEQKAQINTKVYTENTAFDLAMGKVRVDDAAAAIVLRMIDAGCPLNELMANGSPPVMNALFEGGFDLAKTLLARGAQIDLLSREKEASLLSAVNLCPFIHALKVIEFLIDHGANLNAKNKDGYTALQMAERRGSDYREITHVLRAAPERQKQALKRQHEAIMAETISCVQRANGVKRRVFKPK